MTETPAMVLVENLVKQYEDTLAVDGLSFQVGAGEILGLVGPNGAGKTSTMRCICGIIPPTSGRIHVGGVPLAVDPVAVKQQIAFVPADPKFFDYLTVREHLQLFVRLYHCEARDTEMDQLLQLLKIEDKQHHLPAALSRGMQQKLMIACALIHKPRILIFDEPFTGLDPLAIRNIKQILHDRAKAGVAVIVSSHLLGMVEEIVDRVLILQHGQKLAHNTITSLSTELPAMREAGLEEIFLQLTGGLDPESKNAPKSEEESNDEHDSPDNAGVYNNTPNQDNTPDENSPGNVGADNVGACGSTPNTPDENSPDNLEASGSTPNSPDENSPDNVEVSGNTPNSPGDVDPSVVVEPGETK